MTDIADRHAEIPGGFPHELEPALVLLSPEQLDQPQVLHVEVEDLATEIRARREAIADDANQRVTAHLLPLRQIGLSREQVAESLHSAGEQFVHQSTHEGMTTTAVVSCQLSSKQAVIFRYETSDPKPHTTRITPASAEEELIDPLVFDTAYVSTDTFDARHFSYADFEEMRTHGSFDAQRVAELEVDGLTGLYSRTYIDKLAANEFTDDAFWQNQIPEWYQDRDLSHYKSVVFFIDLNRFKQIQDSAISGHTFGDLYLSAVSDVLRSLSEDAAAEPGSLAWRNGGDEFCFHYLYYAGEDGVLNEEALERQIEEFKMRLYRRVEAQLLTLALEAEFGKNWSDQLGMRRSREISSRSVRQWSPDNPVLQLFREMHFGDENLRDYSLGELVLSIGHAVSGVIQSPTNFSESCAASDASMFVDKTHKFPDSSRKTVKLFQTPFATYECSDAGTRILSDGENEVYRMAVPDRCAEGIMYVTTVVTKVPTEPQAATTEGLSGTYQEYDLSA